MAKADPWRAHRQTSFSGLALFPAFGGIAAAMVWENPLVGASAYYALLLVGLCSPEGAALCRAALGRKPVGRLASGLADEDASMTLRR